MGIVGNNYDIRFLELLLASNETMAIECFVNFKRAGYIRSRVIALELGGNLEAMESNSLILQEGNLGTEQLTDLPRITQTSKFEPRSFSLHVHWAFHLGIGNMEYP